MEITAAVKEKEKAGELTSDEGIKVVVHIPDNVPETIRQQKINHIYDILTREKTE